MAKLQEERDVHVLVLNPNSSKSMTDGMATAIGKLPLPNTLKVSYHTGPSAAPASINNGEDIAGSTRAVLSDQTLVADIERGAYDAVLVACYSVHSLVPELAKFKHTAVTGIFEATILASYAILSDPHSDDKWGIVTTGKFWEEHLSLGVAQFLGQQEGDGNRKFAGVFSTGLNAGDFHTVPEEEVREKLKAATRKLLGTGTVTCVVMGCGGMAGLEDIIRETAGEVYGEERAAGIFVIDGVKAGVLQLEQAVNSRRAFGKAN